MNTTLKTALQGFAVGASMSVPGISGGSMAILIGTYDRLVASVSHIFSQPKRSIPFLMKFAIGAVAGIALAATAISFLLGTPAGLPLRFLFLGAVAGGIPFVLRSAKLTRLKSIQVILILAGICSVLLIARIPQDIFSTDNSGVGGFLMRMLGGFITAAALVLPGISASHMLYMLGIYDDVMQSIATLNLLPLIPMALGLALGVFLTAKLVDTLMSRHSQGAYLIILGFMFGSLVELIPECDHPLQYLIGVICTACGFFLVKILSSKEQAKDEQSAHSKADK